jgi:hypothetical protein
VRVGFYLCPSCTDYGSHGEPGDECATCAEPFESELLVINVPGLGSLESVAQALAEGEHCFGDDATRAGYALAYLFPTNECPWGRIVDTSNL